MILSKNRLATLIKNIHISSFSEHKHLRANWIGVIFLNHIVTFYKNILCYIHFVK